MKQVLDTPIQDDVETIDLYKDACQKFNIWHIGFKDRETCYERYKSLGRMKGWQDLLGNHFVEATAQTLAQVIADIIDKSFNDESILAPTGTDGIGW